ncbi:MAG: hypothetical protein V7647_535 [Acidobacteriota bacterium]
MLLVGGAIVPAGAQSFDTVGTRAAGMGGAFVAVADDASAAYWNPAGFASGSLFSLVLDRRTADVTTPGTSPAGNRSGLFMALGIPALGVSYYRLSSRQVAPAVRTETGNSLLEAETLVTHHLGATVVQSIVPGLTVGATLKMVRGYASSLLAPVTERDALLNPSGDVPAQESSHFDTDLGVMGTVGKLKAGITVRNALEPSFRMPGEAGTLRLQRQARVGLAVTPLSGWTVAADSDVLEVDGPAGPSRRFAAGTEARVYRKAIVRGGFNLNTTGERARALTAGGSFAATASLFLDVQVTRGSDPAQRGWGLAARFAY